MAFRTKDSIKQYWDTNIVDNGNQEITGDILNVGGVDIIDSTEWRRAPVVFTSDKHIDPDYDGGFMVFEGHSPYNLIVDNPSYWPSGARVVIANNSDYYITITGITPVIGSARVEAHTMVTLLKAGASTWIVDQHITLFYDYTQRLDFEVTEYDPNWELVDGLSYSGIRNGTYEFKASVAYQLDSTSYSVGLKFVVNGVETVYYTEPKDTTDNKALTLMAPYEVTDGSFTGELYMNKESQIPRLHVLKSVLILDQKTIS